MHVTVSTRNFTGFMLGALVVLAPASARSADATAARCGDAYVAGQHLLHDRQLLRARSELLVCARSPCPRALQPECAEWLAEAQRATPSVVIDVQAPAGRSTQGVRVVVDGIAWDDALEGRAREVDPGEHTFRIEVRDGHVLERKIVVPEADKSRELTFVLPARTPSPPTSASEAPPGPARRRGPPASAWILGGVSIVAAGAFGYFDARGLSIRSDLDACRGRCAQERVDAGNRDWIAADVALGVGTVALGLAGWLWFDASRKATRSAGSPFRWSF